MNRFYHVFSEGENVLFRDDEDYVFFNNKFASSSYVCQQSPLAETTMSTHFHSLLESPDVQSTYEFIFKLRKAYSLYYSSRYGFQLRNSFRISSLELTGRESVMNELLYVLKNPVHHYVTNYPLKYPYSSTPYIFMEDLMPPELEKFIMDRTATIAETGVRRKRAITGYDKVPDTWRVLDGRRILPSSFINVPKVRAFWNGNVRSFIFDMTKNQTDARSEIIKADCLDIRSSGLTDVDVCRIIDEYSKAAGRKSFHHLAASERETLARILKGKAIAPEQIRRCLWL